MYNCIHDILEISKLSKMICICKNVRLSKKNSSKNDFKFTIFQIIMGKTFFPFKTTSFKSELGGGEGGEGLAYI